MFNYYFGLALRSLRRNPVLTLLMVVTIGVGIGLFSLPGYLVFGGRFSWLVFVGLGLIWAGGTSNLIDRVTRHGLVTDFVIIRVGPLHTGVFNAADVLVMAGVAVLIYDHWKPRHTVSPRPPAITSG